jgi:hypothetical protein
MDPALMRIACLVLACAACSVAPLSLEGKQCPCVEAGYTCDEQTNLCLTVNDGGMIIDSPSATQCLPPGNEQEVYRYTGTLDGWTQAAGTWTAGASITQTATQAQEAYAFARTAELTNAKDYRIISTPRQGTLGNGSPSYGVVMRAQLDEENRTRYACTWIVKDRSLNLVAYEGNGSTVLSTKALPIPTSPMSFTMEASVRGSTLSCCIREITGAAINGVMSNVVAAGFPGLTTSRMSASFGSFVVLTPQ